jgi:hypothetical protein
MLVPTLDYYDRAIRIYNGTAKSKALCLDEDEQIILRGLSKGLELTSKELYKNAKSYGFNKSEKTMTRNIKGMLKKVNDLNEWIDRETTLSDLKEGKSKQVSRNVQKYQYAGDIFKQLPDSKHVKLDCILFQTVASIDREKAERLDTEWRENGGQCPLISEDTEDIRRNQKTNKNDFCINDCSINDNNIVYKNKDIRRQEIEESMREQNCTQILEYPPAIVSNEQKKDGKNIFLLANGKTLSSGEIVNTDEQKSVDNLGLASLLRRALNKLANSSEYNGIVKDIYAFVNVFNDRTPEYKLRLGQQAILYNAEKQKARGWK